MLITGEFSHYPNSLFTFMKKEIYETFTSERYFFLTLIFELIYDILEKGFFLWKEIDETYILIIGLITPI